MKLLSVLLSVVGVSGLVWACPVGAETRKQEEVETYMRNRANAQIVVLTTGGSKNRVPLYRTSAADLIAQGTTRVTGVEVNQTESGLELILKTVAGSERLVPLILPEGNDLVIDILDATLAFSIRNGVTELNPAPGINKIWRYSSRI